MPGCQSSGHDGKICKNHHGNSSYGCFMECGYCTRYLSHSNSKNISSHTNRLFPHLLVYNYVYLFGNFVFSTLDRQPGRQADRQTDRHSHTHTHTHTHTYIYIYKRYPIYLSSATCTSPAWTSVAGRTLDASLQPSLQLDKNLETYCKPECLSRQDCVTFDSYTVAGKPSCYFSPSYTPLDNRTDSTHWEYTRSCTSSGKSKF